MSKNREEIGKCSAFKSKRLLRDMMKIKRFMTNYYRFIASFNAKSPCITFCIDFYVINRPRKLGNN